MPYEGSANLTAVDICCLATQKLKRTEISRLANKFNADQASDEESDCWRIYEEARKSLLALYPWPNLIKEAKLQKAFDNWSENDAEHNADYFTYARGFNLPIDYIRDAYVRRDPISGRARSEFQRYPHQFIGKLICTDSPSVYLGYVWDCSDLTYFSSDLKMALATLIAYFLARRFLDSDSREQTLSAEFNALIADMKIRAKNKITNYKIAGYDGRI